VTEDEIFSFASNKIRSAWALELLLLLRQEPARSWSVADLVRELRSSETVIVPCLATLKSEGLVGDAGEEGFRYQPASEDLDTACGELAKLYASRPMALAKAIMKVPNEKLSIFSNAFKLKD
jgi:DNA-binding IclR family transcriptional regulator